MKTQKYIEFIIERGHSLDHLNPGSDEYYLSVEDARQAIEILKENNQIPVLGGDILSTKNGEINYAYQIWGSQYHSLEWYCNQTQDEPLTSYCQRSYDAALAAIENANTTAEKLKQECFIVLVA